LVSARYHHTLAAASLGLPCVVFPSNTSKTNASLAMLGLNTMQSLDQGADQIQQMISEAANEGQQITRKQVRRLSDEFTAATSPLLPEEIRQRTAENLLPPRVIAPLVRELAKLPEEQQEDLRKVLRDEPELERVKDVTSTARWLSKAAEAGLAVRAFQQGELNFEKALQEAQRLDALGLLADAVGQAQALESAVLKLHTSWRRLGGLQERLWVESGSSTPHLRDLLIALQTLSGSTMRVSLGELAGGKRVRLQLVEESPDRLEAPPHPTPSNATLPYLTLPHILIHTLATHHHPAYIIFV
jgi:hypothetical protein